MAISTSFNLNLPTTTANPAFSATAKLPTTTALSLRQSNRLTVSATASISTKPHNLLETLHLKSPFSSTGNFSGEKVQTLKVYEFNEGDRRSPAFLKLSKLPEKSLGDIVTFTNKIYSGDLAVRHGITAGMIMYIENDGEGCGDRYEAVYSFYFGKFGHVSVQGPYFSEADSELAVTGGSGVFEGAHGKVKLTNVAYPYKLFYTFEIKGMKGRLPRELIGGEAVDPESLKTL